MRFFVDHCVPAEVVVALRAAHFDAWSAYQAGLQLAADEDLIVYAADKGAVAVTTNRDFAARARRMGVGRVIYLRCLEHRAGEAMVRALDWLEENHLPDGRVLRVPITGGIVVLTPAAGRRSI